ncbi:trypsin-like peptidase domain-containing protein [Streptomyces sp. NPDC048604]|uniref:VMAP-C domain-containing protein n=1 Tax=Streptomyces sp. NPDC048604 TaxID=3365578 RepID=UPI00371E4D6A
MSRHSPLARLQELLEECRVLVTGVTQGTGFFVAPGYVVTSAHVSGAEPGARVAVAWGGIEYEGVIRAASEAGRSQGLWPFPDLAIVELPAPPEGHACVWLDPVAPSSGTELTATGHSSVYERRTAAGRTTLLRAAGRHGFHGGRMVELTGGEVNHGLSGGPLLSHRTGGVCAVVKLTRKADTAMGGLGAPVGALRLLDPEVCRTVMRAHDRFHAADTQWTALADRLARDSGTDDDGPQLTPASARRLLGALAELPVRTEAAAHLAAFVAVSPEGRPPRAELPLLDHRDVFTELAALMPPQPGALPYELAFAADRAREAARDGARGSWSGAALLLRDRVLTAAGDRLGEAARRRLGDGVVPGDGTAPAGGDGEPPADGVRPSVIGRIRHSMRDRRLYHVMVWRFRSPKDITPAGPESEALPLDRAVALLAGLLPEQVEIMGGLAETGLIELILPREALDEDFPQLRLPEPFEWTRLGAKQQVVVRPLERHEAPSLHGALERRWRQLDGRTMDEALVCVCGRDAQHKAALGASFDLDPTLAALALAGSPRSGPVEDAYRVAVASGVPMMTWHRGSDACERADGATCGLPGRQACRGGAFYAAARKELGDVVCEELPQRVWKLRAEALLQARPGEHIGGDIVLLWDDPGRQLPRVPLAPAEEGSPR